MVIDTSGKWWTGDTPTDVLDYLEAYSGQSYQAEVLRASACACGSSNFHLFADQDEGAAKRVCVDCADETLLGDSAEVWAQAKPRQWKCHSCKASQCNVGVGFALYEKPKGLSSLFGKKRAVRWLFVGCRCLGCGTLGCPAEWKVAGDSAKDITRNV